MGVVKPKQNESQRPIKEMVKMTRSQRELRTVKMSEARENASDQVVIGFSEEFDWLRKWHVFSRPITAQSRLKKNQSNPKSQTLKF